MTKTNIKNVEVKDNELQEVIKECGLSKISFMVCGELQSIGDFLSRDTHDINSRINILITGCLERLSLARTTLRFAQGNEGKLDEHEINGIETAVNEVYSMLAAAILFEMQRPIA